MAASLLIVSHQKLQAQAIPYSYDFEAADTSFHLSPIHDTLAWRLANGGISSSRCLLSDYVTNAQKQDAERYFAAKGLNLTAGYTYQVAFQSKVAYSNRRKIKLALNTTANRDSASLIHDFGTLAASETYQAYSTTFTVAASGQYFLIYYAEMVGGQVVCPWYTDDFAVTLLNTPPSVTLVEPSNNSWFNPDQSVGFAASVSDAESNVVKVEFYEGTNKVAEDFTPNGLGLYTGSYLPANGGSQTLTAKAIDNFNASGTSNSRTINVRYLPQATITNLTAYSNYFPGWQRVTATATDQDGTIQYVVFYLNEDSIGTDSTAPYEMDVPLVYDENQEHRYMYAKAVDNDGLMGSDALRINVLQGTCSLTTPNSTLKQTMCMGDSVELSSEGEMGTTGFQWLYKNQPEGNWENIASTKPKIFAHQPGFYAILWFYENNAVCTTGVDTVSVFEVRGEVLIPTDSPYTATAHGIGGTEPYTYSWNTGICVDQFCNAIMVSDLTSYIIVTAQDNNACSAQDTIEIGSGCIGNQMTWLNNIQIENYASKMEAAENSFQNFIAEQKEILSQSEDKNLFSGGEITIPIVFGVYNDPNDQTGGFTQGYIKGLFTTQFSNQITALNKVFFNNKYEVGGKTYTIRFCLAEKDDNGNSIAGGYKIEDNAAKSIYYPDVNDPDNPNNPNQPSIPQTCLGEPYLNRTFNYCDWVDRMQILANFSHRRYLKVIVTKFMGTNALGFSTPPSTILAPKESVISSSDYDGVMLAIQGFHGASTEQLGKVLAHEVGHWLNLEHTFQNFCNAYPAELNNNNFGVSADPMENGGALWDLIKDTKVQKTIAAWNADSECPDMPSGYYTGQTYTNMMDYRRDAVRTTFSIGQRERMIFTLAYYRPELYTPENLAHAGIQCYDLGTPPSKIPLAYFTLESETVCGLNGTAATTISAFTNSGFATNPTYTWSATLAGTTNAASGVTFEHPASAGSQILAFNTTTIGDKEIVISLKVTHDGIDYLFKRSVFVIGTCLPCRDPNKSRVVFGNAAGLEYAAEPYSGPRVDLGPYGSANKIASEGGTVVVSDEHGKLLFYASGSGLWNGRHEKLNVSLFSDENSFQYGVAMKAPNYSSSNQIYWLFTVPSSIGGMHNKGLRYHLINVSSTDGINATTPVVPTDINLPVTIIPTGTVPPTACPVGENNAVLVSEKITAIPLSGGTNFAIVVQGPPEDADWGKLFYAYKVTGSGLETTAVPSNAMALAEKGVLKVAPLGNKVLSTYSKDFDAITGNGNTTGASNARLFSFDHSTLVLTSLKQLQFKPQVALSPSLGGSFSPDGNSAYLNINRPTYAGIYKFDLTSTASIIGGVVVDKIRPGTKNAVHLMLAADNTILISQPSIQGYFLPCCTPPSVAGQNLGIIHFPNDYTSPGLNWNGPILASSPQQAIRSRTGLPNFVDALPSPGPAFGKENNPIPLGTNPGSCCEEGPRYLNVACMQNNNSTGGNEAYFGFTLQRSCTSYVSFSPPTCATNAWEFTRPLRVEVSGIDFGVTGTLKYLDADPNIGWANAPGSFSNGVLNISISDLNILNPTDQTINFRLIVDANSPSASGNFAAKVNYRHYDQQPNGTSCCRMAVSDEVFENENQKEMGQEESVYQLRLFPNPAKDQIILEILNGWDNFKIFDMNGRLVWEGNLETGQNRLETRTFQNGLYRILVAGKAGIKSLGFQVLR